MNPVARGFARLFDGLAAIWWLIWRAALALLTLLVRHGSQWIWGTTLSWWASALIAAGAVLLPWILVWLFG